ncbi:MAG: hypothetical protein AMS16_03265 [Planctomycetes bacterium DG_58]|nr:MAG: hypothetical protein AMS16_03265 [Planctomycetes bacterium DG_58]
MSESSQARRLPVVLAILVFMLLSLPSEPSSFGAGENQKGGRPGQGAHQVVERYRKAWEDSLTNFALDAVGRWVKDLVSEDISTRTDAIKQLKASVGLDFGFKPEAAVDQRRKAQRMWQGYARNLEVAIREKVPKLLEMPTDRNWHPRAMAAIFLGEEAPNPIFLPLLRRVVADPQNRLFVRSKALTSITQIPHEGLMEYLIRQLDTDLAPRAAEQFRKLTDWAAPWDKDYEKLKKKLEKWWAENKTTFEYVRMRAMFE